MIIEIAVVWPAGRLVFYPIVDSTKMEASIKTYATVTGKQGHGPEKSGLLEMRDVKASGELTESSKNMLKKGQTDLKSISPLPLQKK